ncbi:hypothetical protein BT69DRAFT_1327311 [Atractiella rhizophila]|nr:hypothetical protein BT69DRAFT_1327311 [Atractiella rhizophila]
MKRFQSLHSLKEEIEPEELIPPMPAMPTFAPPTGIKDGKNDQTNMVMLSPTKKTATMMRSPSASGAGMSQSDSLNSIIACYAGYAIPEFSVPPTKEETPSHSKEHSWTSRATFTMSPSSSGRLSSLSVQNAIYPTLKLPYYKLLLPRFTLSTIYNEEKCVKRSRMRWHSPFASESAMVLNGTSGGFLYKVKIASELPDQRIFKFYSLQDIQVDVTKDSLTTTYLRQRDVYELGRPVEVADTRYY